MKKYLLIALVLSGCGYRSRDNELVGQIKKVELHTPLVCPAYYSVDLSLGIIQNGIGSMSREDIELLIPTTEMYQQLKDANGKLVKVRYNTTRTRICFPFDRATAIAIAQ